MSSTLKILVDIQCFVYCDFEQVGEAIPDSIFKMELRKGTYILDFKIDGTTIVSKEYIMKSDNEEALLRVNLSEALSMYKREKKYSEIANTNADIQYKDGDWWIVNNDNGCEIKLWYNIEDRTYSTLKTFDEVGLRAVNIGGTEVDNFAYFTIKGGKWGCINKYGEIQIPIIYDSSVYFYNNCVAKAILDGKDVLINKYGEQLYDDLYDSLKGCFFQNQIVCKNGKYGVIDTNGKYIIPIIYDNLERVDKNDTRFIIKVNNKYGIVDHNNNLLIPCIYDSIVSNKYVISVCSNNKWGLFDSNLKSIVPIKYEIFNKDDNSFDKRPVLVCKNGYYGILNINISKPNDMSSWNGELNHISEIVPCVYNTLYDEHGREIEPHKVNISFLDRTFFVKIDKEKLHCYKYRLQANKNMNSPIQYTAICEMHFLCESFRIAYGMPYKEYLVFENEGTSTITDGSINLKVPCKKEEVKEILVLPNGCKYIVIVNKEIYLFENNKFVSCMNNAELCFMNVNGVIYGVKKDGKYAIYSSDFHQCTPFEYDHISADEDYDNIEIQKSIHGKRIYGEYSYKEKRLISFGYLRYRLLRSQYNWAEKYNISNQKEGIISFNPKGIVVPFKYDYIRLYTGNKSTVLVVAKEFSEFPQKRYALMNTKQELLTEYIFRNIRERDCRTLNDIQCELIHNDNDYSYATFDLTLNDINEFAPFMGYQHDVAYEYDKSKFYNEATTPFKNIRFYIDTETTGLPIDEHLPNENSDNWPHLVQVAFIIEDDNFGILSKRNIIVRPEGYIIPESSTKIHGITTDYARKVGINRKTVISLLDRCLANTDSIIGHNVSFDINVIKAEIFREKGHNALSIKRNHQIHDTMILGMNICKIQNSYLYSRQNISYKYPKLDELYYKLFNKHFENQHDAIADIQATYDCYNELIKR